MFNDFGAPISLVCGEKSKGGVLKKRVGDGMVDWEKAKRPRLNGNDAWRPHSLNPHFFTMGSIVAQATSVQISHQWCESTISSLIMLLSWPPASGVVMLGGRN